MDVERVHDLVTFVHVADVAASIDFYERLGFAVINRVGTETPEWAFLRNETACLMVAAASEPVEPEKQGVLLYLYARNLRRLREQLIRDGVVVGEISFPDHMPEGEMSLTDPDGYRLVIGQLADPSHRK